jgi:hypothetical protein
MSAQAAPDAVRGNDEAAPSRARELGRDPARAEAWMAQREGDDPLLNKRGELVGHPRPPALTRTQCTQTLPLDLALPGVVGGTVHTEGTAGSRNPDPPGEVNQLQPVAEEDVILRHATRSFRLASKRD